MGIRSLGYRTDLMLLDPQGSVVERRDGYRVVRMPDQPAYHWTWGNYLLLDTAPAAGTVRSWVDVFHREFPVTPRIGIGVDGAAGEVGDLDEVSAAGLRVGRRTVLTARSVSLPPHPNRAADIRVLETDQDWRSALALWEATNTDYEPSAYREVGAAKLRAMRRLQDKGLGAWLGAFLGGKMVCGLGVFCNGGGLARFQNIETHPDHRRRGLAGTLIHAAAEHALHELPADTLVIRTNPSYHAIRVYRSLGFTDTETWVQLQG